MSEIVQKLEYFENLDKDIHWFCPRSSADDQGVFYDEDLGDQADHESPEEARLRKAKIQEADNRRRIALESFEILAYDGEDALRYQQKLKACLQTQLTRCDICIREFHRARGQLRDILETTYSAEDVSLFLEKYDDVNNARIVTGLNEATDVLMDLPPDQRSIRALGDGIYALFDALQCPPFLQKEDLLRDAFDRPFRLVQTKKKIKLPCYAPGMTALLFSEVQERNAWAFRNFAQIDRSLSGTEFEFSVKPFFESAMKRVNIASLELGFLPTFWRATKLILSKFTPSLIVDHLRAMDINLFKLSLEHFQIDSSHFADLVACYQTLLELNSNAFWDAMSPIPPQTIIETICQSPSLEKLLASIDQNQDLNLKDMMAWASTFVKHIKPANLVVPLRTLLDQLLNRFQGDKYSRYARNVTWQIGLSCLVKAIDLVSEKVEGGPVCSHLIEVVSKGHMPSILQELEGIGGKTEMALDETEQIGLQIVQSILNLSVKGMARDRRVILKTRELDHELTTSSLGIWKMMLRHIRGDAPAFSCAVLSGISNLLSLEKFPPALGKAAPKHALNWNSALNYVLTTTNEELLERIDGYNSEQLLDLLQDPSALQGIVRLLCNGDDRIHQSALGILKNLSGEDDRRSSLMHLVKGFFSPTISAFANTLTAISRASIYTPCPVTLKLCTDLYSCLCDSQDGRLREELYTREQDLKALDALWKATWDALATMFEQTETWSSQGYEKSQMQQFCRGAMDFADHAFDQYAIVAAALAPTGTDVGNRLLQSPTRASRSIFKWLRLRDDWLISKAVGLTSKILVRLQQVDIKISDDALSFLGDVVTSGEKNAKVKTKLTMNQKAELQQALEQHQGEPVKSVIDLTAPAHEQKQKQKQKQGSLQGWMTSGVKAPSINIKPEDRSRLAFKKGLEVQNKAALALKQREEQRGRDFAAQRQQAKAEQEKARQAALARDTVGGSTLLGFGDLGKVHSAKGQNVMVSSDEESEEENDDDLDKELFGTTIPAEKKKKQQAPLIPVGAQGLRPDQKKAPTKIQRTARSHKDMRARLAPDLAPLHRTMLGWDYFHNGDYPPSSDPDSFAAVSNAFTDPLTYERTFEPLLMLEAWQGMVRSREENSSKPYEIKVSNRSNVDSFIEISSSIGHAENKDLSLQEGDIILFSKSSKPAQDESSPHCLARIYRVKRQKQHLEIVYQTVPGSPLAAQLTTQAVIYGLKVQSITPLEREYGALKALKYYDLCNQIVRAKPSTRISFSDKQVATLQDVYNVNKAQSEAINAALENDGFSLIQGPPGSGKTKTIVAIVGGLLTQTLNNPAAGATKISMPKPSMAPNAVNDAPPKKLLVCAPSNAAVDELVMRLKGGVKTKGGTSYPVNVVRIGRSDAINSQVLDVTMDELVAKRMGGGNNDTETRKRNAELFKEHESISAQLRELYQQRDSGEVKGAELRKLEDTLTSVRRRKNELGVQIDNVKDQERNAGRETDLNRKRAQQAVLDSAHVICATLSGSGHDMFRSLNVEFETVIIDEAAQCVEMSSLIPLKYGCVKCIMVGDPKQLPPTVFSKEAAKFQYEQSLFVRMQNNFPDEVHLLDTQYRMHPSISVFPSRTFYDGLLKDGNSMAALRKKPWHKSALLAPYRFYDVKGQHQSEPKGHSLVNLAEIDIAMALYDRLMADFKGSHDFVGQVGIITPYKSQLRALKERFARSYGESIFDTIEFNTTDAFQGRESEIIIFSCVRASPAGGIGFLQDIRRMNVGLTRAKSSLWVLGNSDSLVRGQYWRKLVEDAQARDCYTTGNIRAMLDQPSSNFPASEERVESMFDVRSHLTQMDSGKDSRTRPVTTHDASRPDTAARATGDGDRMEGVRVRFADRVTAKKSHQRPTPGFGYGTAAAPPAQEMSEDIEMEEADDGVRATTPAIAGGSGSRAETPLSGSGESRAGQSGQSNGTGGRPPPPIPTGPKLVPAKRALASPFMPTTNKRPRPPY